MTLDELLAREGLDAEGVTTLLAWAQGRVETLLAVIDPASELATLLAAAGAMPIVEPRRPAPGIDPLPGFDEGERSTQEAMPTQVAAVPAGSESTARARKRGSKATEEPKTTVRARPVRPPESEDPKTTIRARPKLVGVDEADEVDEEVAERDLEAQARRGVQRQHDRIEHAPRHVRSEADIEHDGPASDVTEVLDSDDLEMLDEEDLVLVDDEATEVGALVSAHENDDSGREGGGYEHNPSQRVHHDMDDAGDEPPHDEESTVMQSRAKLRARANGVAEPGTPRDIDPPKKHGSRLMHDDALLDGEDIDMSDLDDL